MKITGFLFGLLVLANCSPAWAQTNAPAKKTAEQLLLITSDSGYYDGLTNRMVYIGHVFVTDHANGKLNCERLTVDLPPDGEHPTNIVAETNVVVDILNKGQTNHITANKAIYAYHVVAAVTNLINAMTNVVPAVTNETITFTGGNPKYKSPDSDVAAEPIIIHIAAQSVERVEFPAHVEMEWHIKSSGNGTNTSPFGILK
jgi:hypothetical protein